MQPIAINPNCQLMLVFNAADLNDIDAIKKLTISIDIRMLCSVRGQRPWKSIADSEMISILCDGELCKSNAGGSVRSHQVYPPRHL